jgi:hypothetical protein
MAVECWSVGVLGIIGVFDDMMSNSTLQYSNTPTAMFHVLRVTHEIRVITLIPILSAVNTRQGEKRIRSTEKSFLLQFFGHLISETHLAEQRLKNLSD